MLGDHVYLRVRARKSSLNLGSRANLSSRYYGPFEVLERIGHVAYRLAFPTTRAHNVFHVSLLNKYVHDPNHVINPGCDSGGTRGRVPNQANAHPR